MSLSKHQLLRIARDVQTQLQICQVSQRGGIHQKLQRLVEQMERLGGIERKLGICEARHWKAAAAELRKSVSYVLRDLPFFVQDAERAACPRQGTGLTFREIYEELLQMQEEFGELRYRSKERVLSVSTSPIELEAIYLGPFEIQLHLARLSQLPDNGACSVAALDPHPAASNDIVTHPHVSDEHLCAGDAQAAIQEALANGRLCDFFVLVRSVLTTYNPESPYIALDKWYGTPCYDCGYIIEDGESTLCSFCEREFCDECSSFCRCCDENTCVGCLEKCRTCEDLICPSCMTNCPFCGERLCRTCVEENQCPCLDKENEDEQREHPEETEDSRDANAAGMAGSEAA